MPEPIKLKKHTLNLRDGDFDIIDTTYRNKGVKASEIIRMIVSNYVDKIQAKLDAAATPIEEIKIDE